MAAPVAKVLMQQAVHAKLQTAAASDGNESKFVEVLFLYHLSMLVYLSSLIHTVPLRLRTVHGSMEERYELDLLNISISE